MTDDALSVPNCPECLHPMEIGGSFEQPRWVCERHEPSVVLGSSGDEDEDDVEVAREDDDWHDQIASYLWSVGRAAAHKALLNEAVNQDDSWDFDWGRLSIDAAIEKPLYSGLAVEWLLRSLVAYKDPALLADRMHPESMISFSRGATQRDLRGTAAFKTASFDQTLKLAGLLYPNLAINRDAFEIGSARNLVAHMGLATRTTLLEGPRRLVRVVEAIIAQREVLPVQFWSEEVRELVAALRSQEDDPYPAGLEERLIVARRKWHLMSRALNEDEKEALVATAEEYSFNAWVEKPDYDPLDDGSYRVLRRPCPVDGGLGELVTYLPPKEADDDPGAIAAPHLSGGWAVFDWFDCPLCSLHLEKEYLALLPGFDLLTVDQVLAGDESDTEIPDFLIELERRRGRSEQSDS